jgi:hypothetical protein
VVASGSLFEFLSDQAVVDTLGQFEDPAAGCSAGAAEAYALWLRHETRVADLSVVAVQLDWAPC